MLRYAIGRMAQTVPLALVVCGLVFSLIHLIPGDPVEIMLGDGARPAEVEALRRELGLDRPLGRQFVDYFAGLARFDLGSSLRFRRPVTELLLAHYPATLELALASMLAALALALPLGILAALARGRALDHGSRLVALLGVSIPNFWLGPMLIWLFAIHFDWLPVSGRDGWASLILPAITLGTALAGLLTRMVRSSLVGELAQPYLVAARAKGLGRSAAVARHAVRNAAIPVVTVVGLQFGAVLTGAIITETIFSWPGIGRLIVQAIQARDYPLVQGGVLAIALTYLLVNLLTDLTYAVLDARIRLA